MKAGRAGLIIRHQVQGSFSYAVGHIQLCSCHSQERRRPFESLSAAVGGCAVREDRFGCNL